MNGKAHQLRRIAARIATGLTTGLALVASVSLLAAQSAAALDGRSPDTRAAAAGPLGGIGMALDARSPDTREAAGPGGAIDVASITAALDLRSPDAREAARLSGAASTGATIRVASTNPPVVDMRSPDARDATEAASTSTATTTSGGFEWGDFWMGAGVATGSLLLLAGAALAGRATGQRRGGATTT